MTFAELRNQFEDNPKIIDIGTDISYSNTEDEQSLSQKICDDLKGFIERLIHAYLMLCADRKRCFM